MKSVVLHAFHAVQAADTPLDVLRVPGFCLVCPFGIGNVRAAEADEILNTFFQLLFCLFRRTDQVCGKDGNANSLFDRCRHIFAPAGFKGGRFQPVVVCVVSGGRHIDRIRAGFLQPFCHLHALLERVADARAAGFPVAFVHTQAHDHGKAAPARGLDAGQDLQKEAHTVF